MGNSFVAFPKTRYQGSKRRLLNELDKVISPLEFDTCLDIFGGTASVSYLMKTLGKEVTFNDYLASNAVSARALVRNNKTKLSKKWIDKAFQQDTVEGLVSRVYDGVFFTKEENLQIDTILHSINHNPETKITGVKRDLALHSFFQTLLMKRPFNLFHRANLDIRLKDCERKFGNKVTWEKTIQELMVRNLAESNNAIFDNGKRHRVFNKDALQVKGRYDLVYLDPPYYSPERLSDINYIRYYSFLDGLCSVDDWEHKINFDILCKPLNMEQSSFGGYTFNNDLRTLVSQYEDSIIVMSYKSPGTPTSKEIVDILSSTHKEPSVTSIPFRYSLNKNNGHYLENIFVAYPLR